MERRYRITSLDKDGEVVADKETSQSWCISELQLYFDEMTKDLYNGIVTDILVSKVK